MIVGLDKTTIITYISKGEITLMTQTAISKAPKKGLILTTAIVAFATSGLYYLWAIILQPIMWSLLQSGSYMDIDISDRASGYELFRLIIFIVCFLLAIAMLALTIVNLISAIKAKGSKLSSLWGIIGSGLMVLAMFLAFFWPGMLSPDSLFGFLVYLVPALACTGVTLMIVSGVYYLLELRAAKKKAA